MVNGPPNACNHMGQTTRAFNGPFNRSTKQASLPMHDNDAQSHDIVGGGHRTETGSGMKMVQNERTEHLDRRRHRAPITCALCFIEKKKGKN